MKMDSLREISSHTVRGLRYLAIFVSCVFFISGNAYSQTHTSVDNQAGDWYAGSTWVSGTSPGNFPNASAFNIYGYVRVESGGLTINNNSPTINIYDTLYITGNFTISQGSFTIRPGGLLIITGNLIAGNGLGNFTNNGNVVVKGNVSVSNGHIINNSNFYVFGSTTTSGGGSVGGCFPWQPCSPTAAANIGDATDLVNENPSLSDFVDNNGVLPIELLHFYLEKKKTGVVLHWATATEHNFDRFVIEKTRDGKTFIEIGSVQGKGVSTSRSNYSFTDGNVLLGRTYYRLKAIDFDGFTEYFGIVTANFEGAEKITVAPNPAKGSEVTFYLNYSTEQTLYYRVVNVSGVEVHASTLKTDGFDSVYTIDKTLTAGFYFLIIQEGLERKMVRFAVY